MPSGLCAVRGCFCRAFGISSAASLLRSVLCSAEALGHATGACLRRFFWRGFLTGLGSFHDKAVPM